MNLQLKDPTQQAQSLQDSTALTPIIDAKGDKWLRISHSSTNTFKYCPRKFEFQKIYLDGKERGDDNSIPAGVGKAFHHAYQTFIGTKDLELAQFELLRLYPWHLDLISEKNNRPWDVVMSTFNEACDKYRLDEYEIIEIETPKGNVPCIELMFELKFLHTGMGDYKGISWVGFIDMVMLSTFDGSIATWDIKTHQSKLHTREAEYRYSTQQLPYGIAVEHLLGRKVESFQVNYLDCFLSLTEPRVQHFPYEKTQRDIEEWLTARVIDFRSIKQMLEMSLFPRRDNGCMAFNYPCRFLDICSSRNQDNIEAWFADVPERKNPDEPLLVAEIDLGKGIV